jgi:hypothetical protein
MTANLIGGDQSNPKYAVLFAGGVLVGSGIRVGMWLVPDTIVEAAKDLVR